MKAISIRQPWAELILQGKKTLELRTWTVGYRGPLAIHASRTIDREACAAYGIDPVQLTTGALVGTVELTAITELSKVEFDAHQSDHLATGRFGYTHPMYGWHLLKPQALCKPLPMRGRMGLFNVNDLHPQSAESSEDGRTDRIKATTPLPIAASSDAPAGKTSDGTKFTPFQLRVIASDARPGAYSLAVFQRPLMTTETGNMSYLPDDTRLARVAELRGDALRAVADHVLDALRRSAYRATDLHANRREPFHLGEETGVRLGLLFLALRPITKSSRIEAISQGLRRMTSEEAYYWYSKCAAGSSAGPADGKAHERALKALRVLLADE